MAVELLRNIEPPICDLNEERLHQLLQQEKDVLVHDIDGTVRGANEKQNQENINLLAQHLSNGLFMVAATGRGEPAHGQFSEPLEKAVKKIYGRNAQLHRLPSFITTFNSAVAQHTFTREVIYDVPIDDELYEAITTHPFVQTIQNLTSNEFKKRLPPRFENLMRQGLIDPCSRANPGIRHNWSQQLQKRYQLTCEYKPQDDWFKDKPVKVKRDDIEALKYFCRGYIPQSAPELAVNLKSVLSQDGIDVSTSTALGFNVVDIARPEVSKQLTFDILSPFMSIYLDKDINDIKSIQASGIGAGDSPLYNDLPLMTMFDVGITNNHSYWPYYEDTGPIILDFQEVKELARDTTLSDEYIQISEMTQFLKKMSFVSGPISLDNLN